MSEPKSIESETPAAVAGAAPCSVAWLGIDTAKALPMEMPHDGKMLITDGKAVSVGRLVGNTWSIMGLSMGKLTHWMPLPLPPNAAPSHAEKNL